MHEYVLKDDDFLVSQTDERGKIIFANDDFCKIAGYTLEELIGQPHNIVRHKDMPREAFQDLWSTVKKNKIWTGYVKNAIKNGGHYWVFAIVFPKTDPFTQKKTYISCRRKPSNIEVEDAQKTYSTLR